jgi:hypothetical protein
MGSGIVASENSETLGRIGEVGLGRVTENAQCFDHW